ncbi:extensin-like [Miscanthus floridulus]|uniref:extensin-like n=1 Tax=Miscanthus floridulus TaxID=154761 RepID=UPI003459E5F0
MGKAEKEELGLKVPPLYKAAVSSFSSLFVSVRLFDARTGALRRSTSSSRNTSPASSASSSSRACVAQPRPAAKNLRRRPHLPHLSPSSLTPTPSPPPPTGRASDDAVLARYAAALPRTTPLAASAVTYARHCRPDAVSPPSKRPRLPVRAPAPSSPPPTPPLRPRRPQRLPLRRRPKRRRLPRAPNDVIIIYILIYALVENS